MISRVMGSVWVTAVPVAQISNLLYRRFLIGKAHSAWQPTAGWKPAIRQIGNLRYVAFASNTMFPCSSNRARMDGGTTVVESYSSINNGPLVGLVSCRREIT